MSRSMARGVGAQRGITLFGLLFWAVLIAFVALVGMRVSPTVIEYFTIQRVVNKIAKEGGTTVVEIRAAFDRARAVEYGITSVSSSDLDVTKDNGDKVVISFAYNKEVELFDPVYLLIKYRGRSN
ncbi:MAG: DUF4845 domain-containing protein [Burkholderiales bacterium]|nr:DUF4845 domain-containing protein [Burkholderiales bacterium]MCH2241692.1 DUF4845 domain-containing protein [Aquabacterium sp.]